MRSLPPDPPPVVELERRLRWRLLPAASFIAIVVALGVVAFVSLRLRPRHPVGLPDVIEARAVAAEFDGHVTVTCDSLRFVSALLGGEATDHAPDAAMLALAGRMRPLLDAAHRQHPADPRVLAALGTLEMLVHDHARAALRFRRACEDAPHYGEGRLGAGVALALQADHTPELWQSRALRLQAIAEFAMVDSTDDAFAAALYDRVRVLRDVGRVSEARFYAARYAARAPRDRWTTVLKREGLLD